MSESIIEFEDVSFAFGHHLVLDHIDFSVEQGEFATIVGPNGGGKTTLLKLILGSLRPDSGRISVFGQAPEKACIKVGYMPQYAHLDPKFPVTVMDVVLMGRLGQSRFGFYTKKDWQAAYQALEYIQIAHLENSHLSQLSGGQRQRVLIARALCTQPDLLLLDEPASNIDPASESALFSILKKLNTKMTILIVSHDLGFVSRYVNRVICVNKTLVVHPTSAVNGMVISEMYGADVCLVRHDYSHPAGEKKTAKNTGTGEGGCCD